MLLTNPFQHGLPHSCDIELFLPNYCWLSFRYMGSKGPLCKLQDRTLGSSTKMLLCMIASNVHLTSQMLADLHLVRKGLLFQGVIFRFPLGRNSDSSIQTSLFTRRKALN